LGGEEGGPKTRRERTQHRKGGKREENLPKPGMKRPTQPQNTKSIVSAKVEDNLNKSESRGKNKEGKGGKVKNGVGRPRPKGGESES